MRHTLSAGLLGLGLFCTAAAQETKGYLNTALSPEQRAHDLVSRMTLQEKALQSINTAPAIPRLDVPAYDYWNEGLHGVARSGYATLFPQAIGMAATWDTNLLNSVGTVVSTEARAKYNEAVRHDIHSIYFGLTVWSPNINIFRDPRWGRGQETYGEDPFLAGSLGREFIRGLQGPDPMHPRVIATPKHFAVHSGPESDRHRFNVSPSRHDLWDTYLPQFRMAIVDGKADSIMCAYNEVDGKPACASDLLLNSILRDRWRFNGFVTSDCGAIDDFYMKTAHRYSPDQEHAAAAGILAGTDTSCGNTYKVLPAAVQHGLLKEAQMDRTLERLFVARMRLGLFNPPATEPYAQIPFSANRSPEHLDLALRTARESMVLLKNDGILPLKQGRYRTIAVIGPNAASISALEGNYNAVPKDPKTFVEALRAAMPGSTVTYSEGAPYADGVSLPVPSTMLQPTRNSKLRGLTAEYFAAKGDDLAASVAGKPVATRRDEQLDFDWNSAAPVAGVQQDAYAVRWTGFIVPPQAGDIEFNMRLAHCYPCNDLEHFAVRIDGVEVSNYASSRKPFRESTTPRFQAHFTDTKPHAIEVTYLHRAPLFGGGLTLEWAPPAGVLQKEAIELARKADLTIAVVGLSPELEGEEMKIQVEGFAGGDRTDIRLPQSQAAMLESVAAVSKAVVVVAMNGSALAMPWADQHANALLEAWYPGEFGGNAIAETLQGKNNPAGRLPVTFYESVTDLPPFDDYSMKNRTYRYFTGRPQYSFGYGLSYTRFAYSDLKLSTVTLKAGAPLAATVTVKNTGARAGDEVAQLYLLPPANGNNGLSPRLQLQGFQRITLKAGESRELHFKLSARELSEVDAEGKRFVQAGDYRLAIGGAQPEDPRAATPAQVTAFHIDGTQEVAQ